MIYNYDYFISYSRKDNETGFVDEFVKRLETRDDFKTLFGAPPRVFFDATTIQNMADWERVIKNGISTSRFLVVLLSPNYFQSKYCGHEFQWWLVREMHRCVLNEGTASIIIVNVPGLHNDGTVAIPQELRDRFPRWVTELGARQTSAEFNLSDYSTVKIDAALAALCRSSRDKVWRQDSASQSPHNYLYPAYNKNFVGRREELNKLRKDLETSRHVALYGLGGVGKTELALTYGHAFAWDYQLGRVYIKSENQTSLMSAILGSGLDLMMDVELEGNEETRFAMLSKALSQRREKIIKENKESGRPSTWGTRLLLILDNVNELNIFKREEWERLPDYFHIVATTREYPSKAAHLCRTPVDALTEPDALELLRVLRPFADDAERDAALEIVRKFGGHAFRVEKIGAYLRVNEWETYRGYLKKTQERFEHLRATIDSDDFDLRHAAICDEECLRPTLEKLTRTASTLLDWSALFGPDSVPVPWLGELAEIDGDELRQGLQELEDYRLLIPVEADSKEQTRRLFDVNLARLHRIAREIVVDQTPDEFRLSALERISEKIDELLSKDESYWLAGGAAWGLDSIADFCFERYEEAKKREPSGKDHGLIWQFVPLFYLYLYRLRAFDRARKIGKASEELSQRRVDAAPDDLQALRDLIVSYYKLGDLCKAEGSRNKAREYYEKALEIHKTLVSPTPDDPQALRVLSFSYDKLGALCNAESSRNEAREYYEKYHEITSQLVSRTPGDLLALYNLSASYDRLGDLCKAEGSCNEAREYYEQSLAIRKQLVSRTPDDLRALRALGVSYRLLGDLSATEGSRQAAREYYEKAREIRERIVSRTPDDIQALRDLSISYGSLGDLCNAEGSRTEARQYYEKGLEIFRKLVSRTPDDLDVLLVLGFSYISLAALSNAEGDHAQAEEYYKKVSEISDRLKAVQEKAE